MPSTQSITLWKGIFHKYRWPWSRWGLFRLETATMNFSHNQVYKHKKIPFFLLSMKLSEMEKDSSWKIEDPDFLINPFYEMERSIDHDLGEAFRLETATKNFSHNQVFKNKKRYFFLLSMILSEMEKRILREKSKILIARFLLFMELCKTGRDSSWNIEDPYCLFFPCHEMVWLTPSLTPCEIEKRFFVRLVSTLSRRLCLHRESKTPWRDVRQPRQASTLLFFVLLMVSLPLFPSSPAVPASGVKPIAILLRNQ